MLRKLLIVTVLVLLVLSLGGLRANTANASQLLPKRTELKKLPVNLQIKWYKRNIHHANSTIRFWDHYRGPYANSLRYEKYRQLKFHERLLHNSRRSLGRIQAKLRRATVRRLRAKHEETPPHLSAWLCIHRYEGSWTDPGAPYYGGLQMDWSFMSNYGGGLLASKGTADHWTPLEQMWVAERGLAVQGFGAWPNTARMCGLL